MVKRRLWVEKFGDRNVAAIYDNKTVWLEFWDVAAYYEQQNVKKVQGTKKTRKTGWREHVSSCSRAVPKDYAAGYPMIDLGHSHVLQTEVEQHSTGLSMNP